MAGSQLARKTGLIMLAAALLSCSAASLSNGSARRRHCTGEPTLQIGVIMVDGGPYFGTANLGTIPGTSAISFEGRAHWSGFYFPDPRSAEGINIGYRHFAHATRATIESAAKLGILEPWALVEFEANCGEPPDGQIFFMTSMRRLDGTRQYPLRITEVIERLTTRNAELVSVSELGALLIEQAGSVFMLGADPGMLAGASMWAVPFAYWRDDHLQVEFRNSMQIAEMGNACGAQPAHGEVCRTISALVTAEQVVRFAVDRKGAIVSEEIGAPTARAESFPPPP